jgi:N-acetylglucosaminyldiphosphoundecaprenol N-acetyl-beta-D-mannosaminyltransferase
MIDSVQNTQLSVPLNSCRFLDVQVDSIRLDQLAVLLRHFVASGRPHQIVTVNVDFVRIARQDAPFRDALGRADVAVPDGMPLVWLSRLLGQPLSDRITGVDVLEQGAAIAAAQGYSIFLLGAEPGVADKAAAVLCERYPGLRIAGTYAPAIGTFTKEENARMVELIRSAQPDLLFVAFGAPRQDVWIAAHREELNVPVSVGIGGSFNFLAGRIPRAPVWLQRAGLEWAYRLSREPGRLWRRYLLGDLPTLYRIVARGLFPTFR